MFRISVLVDDKHVVDILRAVAGRCRGQPEVVPINMPVAGAAKGSNREETLHMFVAALKKTGKKEFLSAEIKQAVQSLGWSSTAYSHYINGAVEYGLLKKGKKQGNGYLWHLVK